MELKDLKVLVVDDDVSLLDLITQVLKLNQVECETAEDGSYALEMVKKKHYDLIISDIRMPIMTGTELLKKIREHQKDSPQKSKIILMTAYSSGEIKEKANDLGADDFLNKPFDISDFTERIIQIIE